MEKVKVNEGACIGCGACCAIASEIFEINDEGFAEAKDNNMETMNEETKNDVMDALEGCPTSAIEIEK